MANCEPTRDRLLDLVYDLLDEAEARTLRAHLDICPRCQEALAAVQGQRQTLARAALPIGADAVPIFARPAVAAPADAESTPADDVAATVPFGAPTVALEAAPRRPVRRRRVYWAGAAAAAAVVLLAALWSWHGYTEGHRERAEYIAQQKDVIREIDTQLAALDPAYKRQVDVARRRLRASEPPHLYVMGPTRVQPRGGEVFQVALHDLDGKPLAGNVKVTLKDRDGTQVLVEQRAVAKDGAASVVLGDDLTQTLSNHTSVQLIAQAEAGTAAAEVQQTLSVTAPTYVAHLMMNKTLYRPGDLLFYRVLVLDRSSLTPPAVSMPLRVSLVDGAGKTVLAVSAATGPGGIAAGELAVEPRFADGDYELRVAALQPAMPEVRPHARKLHIARDGNFHVQADRDYYRPGDVVNVTVQRSLATSSPAQNTGRGKKSNEPAPVSNAQVLVDGKQVPLLNFPGGYGGSAQMQNNAMGGGGGFSRAIPSNGQGMQSYANNDYLNSFQFALPRDLDASRVHIRIVLTAGKEQETIEHELRIVPSRLAVDVFPEGGALIAGVPNRVYYRVRSARGEPVNPEGRVIFLSRTDVLLDGAPGAGTGSFVFTPQVEDTYTVRITGPNGALAELPDPFARLGGAKQGGLVLHTPEAVAAENAPLVVVLRNAGPTRRVLLVAQCRGHYVGQQWALANGPDTPIALGTLPGARGVIRVTAYDVADGTLTPLAERLIYRTPAQRLDLTVLHLGAVVSPRLGPRNVQFELRARDENGLPVDCWGGVAVVDERYRKREPSPLAHFFIAGDVRDGNDLDNAVLLAADTPETHKALDLFLGTAGWRRFQPAGGKGITAGAPIDAAFFGRENGSPRELQAQYEQRLAGALAPLGTALHVDRATLLRDKREAQGHVERGWAELHAFESLPLEYLRMGLGVAVSILFGVACTMLAIGAWRLVRHRGATPLFAGSCACLGMCLVGMLMVASLSVPTEPIHQSLAQRNEAQLPGVAVPSVVLRLEVPSGLPTGPFALAARPSAADAKMAADQVASNGTKGKHVELALQKTPALGGALLRGTPPPVPAMARRDVAKAEQLREKLNRRYVEAVQRQEKDKGAPKPIALAPATAPAAPLVAKGAAIAKKVNAEQAGLARQLAQRVYANVAGESDTLLWDPSAYLASGSAQLAFDVPGAAGSYRVLFLGHTADGRLGFYEGRLEVQPDLGR